MADVEEREAARVLAAQARNVAWAADGTPWQWFLRAISGGRWGRQPSGWTVIRLDAPRQDTPSSERPGWRERAANLAGDVAFAVDYTVCAACRIGWVEWPYTMEKYQRCGLAAAGLAALRLEHPDLSWHTLGGHFQDSPPLLGCCRRGRARELSAARDLPTRARGMSPQTCQQGGGASNGVEKGGAAPLDEFSGAAEPR